MMGQRIGVRPAEPHDAAQWAAMRADLWPRLSLAEHEVEIAAYLEGSAEEPQAVLVAERLDEPALVGFAELSLRAYAEGCHTSPVGYLEGWYVAESERGSGVGRALIAAAEEWARTAGCREFASDTEAENHASAAAHAALGFEEAGLIRCFRKSL